MRTGSFLVTAALMLALAGCAPVDSHPSSTPSSSATPVFASDAEALAAAEKAYAEYETAVDRSLQIPSDEGLEVVATGDALKAATASVASFQEAGRTQKGEAKISRVKPVDLGALTTPGLDRETSQIYACLDVSSVEVFDASGKEVSAPGRQVIFPTVVSLVWSPKDRKLLVSKESVWDGKNFCE